MKFGQRFENLKIPEWADFYVNYKALKKLLSPYKVLKQAYLKSKLDNNSISVNNFSAEDLQRLEYFTQAFEKLIFLDIEKVLAFYNKKLHQIVTKWRKLRLNLIIFKQRTDIMSIETKNEYRSMLKESFQALIKEVKLLSNYISANLEAFQKILKKQKKAVNQFAPKAELKSKFELYIHEFKVYKTRDRLNNFLFSIENEYIDFFHKNKGEGIEELRKIFQGNLISRYETFWFGLFLGFSALLIMLIVVLIWNEGLTIDGNKIFSTTLPIFRGIGLIFVYLWFLAWNVYVWTANNVNYKLIFRFNYHYSQLSEILRRAAAFSTLFLVLLLWYLLIEGQAAKLDLVVGFVPKKIIPSFVWLSFIIYMAFPSKRIFNWPGRAYTYKLFQNILKTPFISMTFPIIWATDQLASFVIPLKDLKYSICYTSTYLANGNDKPKLAECYTVEGITKGALIAIIPLVIRYLQCLKEVYDAKDLKSDAMIDSFKYLCCLCVAILSYLVSLYPQNIGFFQGWIIFAVISVLYCYVWDLKKDWGFLVPNAKYRFLRNELSYNNPHYYYIAMVANLIMRCAWVLSLSPDIISGIVQPELFFVMIGFTEIFRRAVWNFLRVEKEHIANVGNFKAVPDMVLPYQDISFDLNIREDDLFSQDLYAMILNENKEKPISSQTDYNAQKMSVMLKKSSFQSDKGDQAQSLKYFPEEDEHSNLKMLSKITSNPMITLQNKEKGQLEYDLGRYKQDKVQFEVWSKEIKKFKQFVNEQRNKYFIVPNYKDLKIFINPPINASTDSLRDIAQSASKLKKILSHNTLAVNLEEDEEQENQNPDLEKWSNHSRNSISKASASRKMSHDKREDNNKTPLLMEMKNL